MTIIKLFERKRIELTLSCVGQPQQNGRAENTIKQLKIKIFILLRQSGLSMKWWAFPAHAPVFLLNRTFHFCRGNIPYFLLTGKYPDYSRLRVF